MSDSAEVRRMGTRSKAGETPSNTSRISPRRRNIVLGAGAIRSSTVEKAKDGSLIYKRRSSVGSNSAQSVSPETVPTSVQKGQSAPAESREHKRMRTIHTNSAGEEVESDAFCWLCHREGDGVCCELCPRMYHLKCLNIESVTTADWVCPECEKILQAECVDTRSQAMSLITVDQLCVLLKYAVQRMKHADSADFHKPVDLNAVPHYTDYIQTPMDLTTLEKNIRKKLYGSTEAFLADAKYILHNCIVFNGERNKLTSNAKMVLKICKHEMNEIEICPDCYMNSCTKQQENWFCEPCRYPHTLVWAKMKGYPYWPAKALRVVNGQVDVRFFGEHDRAWVPVGQVYLLSKDPPVSIKKGRGGYDQSMEELNLHIQRLKNKFGSFEYAPNKMVYDPYAHIKDAEDGMVTPTKSSTKSPNSTPSSTKSRSPGITPSMRTGTPKTPEKSPSIVTRTASAVKLKYSSIISTRHTKMKGQTIGDNVIVTTDNKPSDESSSGGNSACKDTEESEEPSCKKARLVEPSLCSEDPLEAKHDLSANGKDTMEITVEQNKKTEELNPSRADKNIEGSAGDGKLSKVFLLDEDAIKETKPSKNLTSFLDIVPKVKHTDKKVIDEIENKIKNLQEGDDEDINKKCNEGDTKDDNKDEIKSDNKCDINNDSNCNGKDSDKPEKACESKDVVVSNNQTVDSEDVAESQGASPKALQAESELSGTKSTEAVSEDGLKLASQSPTKHAFLEKIVASCKEKLGVEKALDADLSLKLSISEAEDDSCSSNMSASSTESISDMSKCTDNSPEKNESQTHRTSSSSLEKHVLMEVTESTSVAQPEVGNKEQKIKDSSQKKVFDGSKSNPLPVQTETAEAIPTCYAPTCQSDAKASVSSLQEVNEKLDSRDVIVITDADSHEDASIKETAERRFEAQKSPDAQGSSELRSNRLKSPDVSINQKSSPGPIKIKPQNAHAQKPQTATVLPEKVTPQAKRTGISLINGSDMHSTSPSKEQDTIPSDFSPNTPEIDFTGLNLSRYTNKVMMTVQSTLQEFCMDMINTDAGSVFRKHLQLEVKRLEWRHQQEISEIRHTANLKLLELRAAMELEKEKAIDNLIRELKFKYEAEKKQAVEETKKKQWCANCGKEAIFYCCWNTSYCDYPCQQAHWPHHMSSCTQSQTNQQSHDTRTNQSDAASNHPAINVEKWQPSETQANRVITQTASVIHTQPHNVQFIRPPQRLPVSQVGGSVLRYIQPNPPNPGQRFQHNNPQQFQLSAMNQMNQSQPPLVMVSTGPTHQGQLRPIISHTARGPQSLLLPQAGRLPPNMMQGSGMPYRPDF